MSGQEDCVSSQLFNHENGISNTDRNSFIFQDSQGYIWISTSNGVDKCNGIKCHSFPFKEIDPKTSYIQGNFFEDSLANIWFATYNSIVSYNRKEDAFSSFQIPNPSNDQTNLNDLYHLFYLDSLKQRLWFRAGDYIFSKSIFSNEYYSLPFKTSARRFIYQKGKDQESDRIVGCLLGKPGVDIYEKFNGVWTNKYHDLSELGGPILKMGTQQSESVSWFTSDKGVVAQNINNEPQFQLYQQSKTRFNKLSLLNENQLILCSNNGLGIFDIGKKKVIQTLNNNNSEINTQVFDSFYKDSNNGVWLPHKDGVDYLKLKDCLEYNLYLEERKGFDKGVEDIVEIENKIFILNNENIVRQFEVFEEKVEFNRNWQIKNEQFLNRRIYDIEKCGENNLWLLFNNTICVYSSDGFVIADNLPSGHYNYMHHLKDGTCLVTSSEGVRVISKGEIGFKCTESKYFIDENSYHRIFESAQGDVFIAINTNAIQAYTMKNGIMKTIEIGSDVLSFYECMSSNKIWIGTTKGLGYIDEKYEYHSVLENDWEIGQNSVYSILKDDDQNLWFTTNEGLWKYNGKSYKLIIFRKENGIGDGNFNNDAKIKFSDGRLAFGTSKGLLSFDPKSISTSEVKPKIQIENFTVNDKPFDYDFGKDHFKQNISLNFNQNSIGLEPVVLNYNLPKYNKVRYRIKGYQDNWRIIASGEKIYFTALPAGRKYQLELIGINANNIESETKQLTISIALPFWRRWWFPLLVILGVSLLIWGITNLYYRQKLKEKQIELERQEALNNQRKALADDLHDNLGNDLSEILHISDAASIGSKEKMNTALDTIAEMTIDSMTNMRFMIRVLEGEDESLKGLLYSIREYTNKLLQRHKIDFKVDFPEHIRDVKINGNFKLNFSYLFKECLGNLVKHSQASKAKIEASFDDKCIYFSIEDNGVGFNVKNKLGKGKGLNTMEKRVAILDGRINIESKFKEGTCVEFWIPL